MNVTDDEIKRAVTNAVKNRELAKELLGCDGWDWLCVAIKRRIDELVEGVVFTPGVTPDAMRERAAVARELRAWLSYPERQAAAASATMKAKADKSKDEV